MGRISFAKLSDVLNKAGERSLSCESAGWACTRLFERQEELMVFHSPAARNRPYVQLDPEQDVRKNPKCSELIQVAERYAEKVLGPERIDELLTDHPLKYLRSREPKIEQ